MRPAYEYGAAVRLVRTVRNDGTFPGVATGTVLVRRGSIGYVRDVGIFLQDQLIYSIDFIDQKIRVGCREQELQPADADWIQTLFEFHDKATPAVTLAIKGEIVARPGDIGEIDKVITDTEDGPMYHFRYNGRTFMLAESQLQPATMDSAI